MRDPDEIGRDVPLHDRMDPAGATRPYRTDPPRRDAGPWIAVLVVVALVAALGAWLWWRHVATPPAPAAGAEPAAPAAAAPAPAAAAEPLPPLDGSDDWVRQRVAALAPGSALASWLSADGLVRRFVTAVVAISEGNSPAAQLRVLTPDGGFRVRKSSGRWYVDPASYRRYDAVAEVFGSIDPAAAAALYRRLHPLLDQAFREIGDPRQGLDETLATAIAELVAEPVPDGPLEVVPQGAVWEWADHDLAQRSAAQKHLLRMGRDNAERVQSELRRLAAALGLQLSPQAP
jgi:hypothetical protein